MVSLIFSRLRESLTLYANGEVVFSRGSGCLTLYTNGQFFIFQELGKFHSLYKIADTFMKSKKWQGSTLAITSCVVTFCYVSAIKLAAYHCWPTSDQTATDQIMTDSYTFLHKTT